MKKLTLLLVLMIVAAAEIFSAVTISSDLYDDFFNGSYSNYNEPTYALGPYNAASGISMTSRNYPSRVTEEGKKLTFVNAAMPSDVSLNQNYLNQYYNENIVALAAVYDIPVAYVDEMGSEVVGTAYETGWGSQKRQDRSQTVKVAILKEAPAIEISTTSSSEFMFVSQSHPSYRRRYELAIQPKKTATDIPRDTWYGETPLACHNFGEERENSFPIKYVEDGDPEVVFGSSNFYLSFWGDIILALPYDADSDVSNGVKDGNVIYELTEAEDYSSIVYVSIDYTPVYEVYEITRTRYRETGRGGLIWGSWSGWNYGEGLQKSTDPDITQDRIYDTIAIPFSGYYNSLNIPPTESSASFYVYPYPITSSLNLNPGAMGNTQTYIDIADISLVYNYGPEWYYRNEIDNSVYESCPIIADEDKARIFLSASRNPKESNSKFMFVHKNATSIIEGVNAVGYEVRVRDNDTGEYTSYDGTEHINDNFMMDDDKFLYSKHQHSNPYNHTYDRDSNSVNYEKTRVNHFHTFDGTISIFIDGTSDLMEPGVYESSIYVHLIAP